MHYIAAAEAQSATSRVLPHPPCSVPGIGGALQFRVRVGGQWSPLFNASSVAYAPPTVTGVAVTAVVSSMAGLMDTRGGDILTINGTSESAQWMRACVITT